MKRLTIDDINLIHGLPPLMEKQDMVAFDTEFFGMQKEKLHRPHGVFASMACTRDGHNVYYITDEKLIPEFMERIAPALWTGHNLAFDIRQLRMFTDVLPRRRVWDSMLIEQIRFHGYYNDFGLNDVARRYLGIYLDKTQQKSFEKATELTKEQIIYGALDVASQWMVAKAQREQIDEQDLWIWQNIERPFMWLLLDIKGTKLDTDKWMKIATEMGDVAAKAWQECRDEYGINIRSPKQILQFFSEHKINLDSTNVATLSANVGKHPIIQKILDYRKPAKGSSTYGASWIDDYVEEDGLVYASWNQMGARSGRMCVSADTILKTSNGTFTISDLPLTSACYGTITTHTGEQQPITHKIYKGKEEMFHVKLENGASIKCTAKHRFLTPVGWKRLEELSEGDVVMSYREES